MHLHCVNMKLLAFLIVIATLTTITIADGQIPPMTSSFFVPANSVLEMKDTGMCSKIEIDIVPIYNSTDFINDGHHGSINIDGFIDDVYTDSCYSNSSNTCNLSLTTWTAHHNFTYYFSTNVDAYVTYRIHSNACASNTFYIMFSVFGAIFLVIVLILAIPLIIFLVAMCMDYYDHMNTLSSNSTRNTKDPVEDPVEVTIDEEKN